jgi:hypothetical protein
MLVYQLPLPSNNLTLRFVALLLGSRETGSERELAMERYTAALDAPLSLPALILRPAFKTHC